MRTPNLPWTVALGILVWASVAGAQTYPSKPVRMIVPFSPGGTSDIVGRAIGQKLSEFLGQPVVIDNKGGGGTIIGTDALAKSAPDGYTIALMTPDFTVNPSLHRKLPYDPVKDFEPIALVATYPLVLVAHPAVPAKTVQDLIALAKSKPETINYASGGNGSMPHLSAELFNSMAGVKMTHVPYKGNGPAIIDLVAGRVQVLFTGMPPVEGHVKTGKLKAIAATGKKRLSSARDLPTITESGVPGYEVIAWYGFLAPAGTAKPVIDRLHGDIAKSMNSRETKERLASLGADLGASSPEEYGTVIRSEIAKWAKVVKDAEITIE